MMKKLLAIAFCVSAFTAANAQCTINTSYTVPGIYPDTVTNLPIAYVGTGYTTDLQFRVLQDTVTQLGTFPVQDAHIDSIVGIPAGFNYTFNPASGTFPGGSNGCVQVTGLATAGQENGGPQSNGIYPIIVYYTATVVVFTVPTAFPTTKTGYRIQIVNNVGMKDEDLSHFSVSAPMPNPATGKTDIHFNTLQAGDVEFTLFNVLGSEVKKETIKADKGINNYRLDASALAAGMYIYSMREGNSLVTRRLSVTH